MSLPFHSNIIPVRVWQSIYLAIFSDDSWHQIYSLFIKHFLSIFLSLVSRLSLMLSNLSASSGWAAHTSNCYKTSFVWFNCPSTNWLLCPLKETWLLLLICSSLWQSSLSLRFYMLILRLWSSRGTTPFPSNSISLIDMFSQLIAAPYTTNA